MTVNRIDGLIGAIFSLRRLRGFTRLGARVAILGVLFALVMTAFSSGADIVDHFPEYETRLAAVLHDIAANHYHRTRVPGSDKHAAPVRFLTYSSLSRNAQYGNRVAYEVLRGHSPRLDGPVGPDDGADAQAEESSYEQLGFGFEAGG